ncbi:MAG: ABC transporter permease [Bryobacteraceae bacterium]
MFPFRGRAVAALFESVPLADRDFTARDTETSPVVGILNESMAKHLFGRENPIGKHFEFRRRNVEIVGVVSNSKFNTLRDKCRRMFFIPNRQGPEHLFAMCVVVPTAAGTPALTARIRDEMRSMD